MNGGADPRVVLVGAGAQAKYACETFRHRGVEVIGVMNLAQDGEVAWPQTYGCGVFAVDEALREPLRLGATHSVICVADAAEKAQWSARAEAAGFAPLSAIHPRAVVATTAQVGPGCIVNACAVIQPFAVVGRAVMIHANVTIEHDARVEDFANLAPGVSLAGWAHVEEAASIFTGAAVMPRVRIGRGAVVGAGAAVLSDVSAGSVAVGVPAHATDSVRS